MKCNACNLLTDIPFHCKYCDLYFCGDHQLPENHNCEKLWLAAPPTKYSESSTNTDFSYPSSIIKTNKFQFPDNEKIHLLVGTILVMLVGLTLNTNLLFQIPIIYVLIMALAFSCSFLGHELAHKFMAQHYGLWAEFRLVKIGDIDLQPCGGTHVARTGEVGNARVKKIEKKGKHNRRVNIVLDW